jgi:hypothetical protein
MYFLAICLIVAMFGTLSALAGTGVPNSLSAYQLTNDFVSPMGGPSSASAVTIASCNMLPYEKSTILDYWVISVNPASRDVAKDAGITTFNISNTGIGTMIWTASVTSGGSWLSITSGASGSNSGTRIRGSESH